MLYSASSVVAQLQVRLVLALLRAPVGLDGGGDRTAMMLLKRTHYRKLQNPAVAFAAMGWR